MTGRARGRHEASGSRVRLIIASSNSQSVPDDASQDNLLTDTAVMIADAGRVMSNATLRDQGELLRPVASDPNL